MTNGNIITKIKTTISKNPNKYAFIFILVFSIIIALSLAYLNYSNQILGRNYRDIYLYLIKALKYSGYNLGYNYLDSLYPLMSLICSVFFRLGFISELTLFLITGSFYVFAMCGFYLLLKLRYNTLFSVTGSLIYGAFGINMWWISNGSVDIPSIAFSIWAVYLLLIALDTTKSINTEDKRPHNQILKTKVIKNKFLKISENQTVLVCISFILATLAFFTKYTESLIFGVLFLAIFTKKDILKNLKKYLSLIIKGIISALIIFGLFVINLREILNPALNYLSQSSTKHANMSLSSEVGNNIMYYISTLDVIIHPIHILSYIVMLIVIIGAIYAIYRLIKNVNKLDLKNKVSRNIFLTNKKLYTIAIIISIIGIISSFPLLTVLSFAKCELILFISLLIFSYLINQRLSDKYPNFHFDIVIIGWFLICFIFLSGEIVKANRYFTMLTPAFSIFILYGLKLISTKLNKIFKREGENLSIKKDFKKLIPVLAIIILLISAFGTLGIDKHDPLVPNEIKVANWLKEYDSDYRNQVMWSTRGPIYTWYLQKEVKYLEKGGTYEELSNILRSDNSTYFITHLDGNITGYKQAIRLDGVTVYQRIDYTPDNQKNNTI